MTAATRVFPPQPDRPRDSDRKYASAWGLSSIEPNDGDEEAPLGLVVSSGYGAVLLQSGEEVFDQMPRLKGRAIESAAGRAISLWRDHGCFAGGLQRLENALVGVVGFICDERIGCIEGNSSSTPARSRSSPPVRLKPIGLPRAPTKAWILALNPPRDLPVARSSP
jgi:hypothetical protein